MLLKRLGMQGWELSPQHDHSSRHLVSGRRREAIVVHAGRGACAMIRPAVPPDRVLTRRHSAVHEGGYQSALDVIHSEPHRTGFVRGVSDRRRGIERVRIVLVEPGGPRRPGIAATPVTVFGPCRSTEMFELSEFTVTTSGSPSRSRSPSASPPGATSTA